MTKDDLKYGLAIAWNIYVTTNVASRIAITRYAKIAHRRVDNLLNNDSAPGRAVSCFHDVRRELNESQRPAPATPARLRQGLRSPISMVDLE